MFNHKKTLGLARFPLSVLGVAVVSMGLYACGGDSDDGAPTTPKTLVVLKVTEAPQSVLARSAKSLAQAMSLPIGLTQQYVATGTYSDSTTADLTATATWSSSDESVATVAAGAATAALEGTTDIGACQGDVCSAPVSLTVDAAVVTGLTITPPQSEVREAGVTQLTAMAKMSDQRDLDVTDERALSWSISDDTILSLSSGGGINTSKPGQIRGLKEGDATVSVAGQLSGADFSAESEMTVTPLDVSAFTVPETALKSWSEADTYCKTLTPEARLPTEIELSSIRYKASGDGGSDVCSEYGWPMGDCQSNGVTNEYWSSSDGGSDAHYVVDMGGNQSAPRNNSRPSHVVCIR